MEEKTAEALPTGSGVRAVHSPYEALMSEELAQYRKAVMESGLSAQDILEWRLEKHGRELRHGGHRVGMAFPEASTTADGEGTVAKPYTKGNAYEGVIKTSNQDVVEEYANTFKPAKPRWT